MRPRLIGLLVTAAVLTAAAGVGSLALARGGGGDEVAAPPAAVSEHATPIPEEERTVFISRTMPMPSGHELRLSAMLEEGEMPHGTILGEVLTDTECTPDEEMISRCRNVVGLADGRQIVLRHPHRMSEISCLAPGERVRLVPSSV